MLILFLIALLIRTLIPHLAGAHHGHIELALTNTSIITPSGLKSFGLHPTGLYRLFNQKKNGIIGMEEIDKEGHSSSLIVYWS